jgi:uncharacterized protein YoxC
MTFSLVEVLVLLMTIGVLILVVVLSRTGQKLGRAIESFEETTKRVNALEPQIRSVLEKLEGELDDLQKVTRQSQKVAADVAEVSDESRRVVLDVIHDLESLQLPERYRAAVAGAKAGLAVLRSASGRNGG